MELVRSSKIKLTPSHLHVSEKQKIRTGLAHEGWSINLERKNVVVGNILGLFVKSKIK
jgi:hypothetical protein